MHEYPRFVFIAMHEYRMKYIYGHESLQPIVSNTDTKCYYNLPVCKKTPYASICEAPAANWEFAAKILSRAAVKSGRIEPKGKHK